MIIAGSEEVRGIPPPQAAEVRSLRVGMTNCKIGDPETGRKVTIVTHSQFYKELLESLEDKTPEQVEEGRKSLLAWADRQEEK